MKDFAEEGEAIYVQQAGQVLFAPFLPMLFERLGWLTQGVFKSEKANRAAVQVVGYLATGRKF
ncbi:MAG: hypothetical protein IPM82_25955 [Saprospiraceae bacterium]|nr:hypothetical protein [Saprospiraceae bacterium]